MNPRTPDDEDVGDGYNSKGNKKMNTQKDNHTKWWFNISAIEKFTFLTFLFGILIYGITFAWYMLTSFDIINLIRDINLDDAFYYFQIARNFADGKFSTFDDGITRTNGYHPVWMLFITPFYLMFDSENVLFAIKALEIILIAGGVILIILAARLAKLPWILLFGVLAILYDNHHALLAGTEAACALFFLGATFLAAIFFSRDPVRHSWLLIWIVSILPWIRLEYIVISLILASSLVILLRLHLTEHQLLQIKMFAPLAGVVLSIQIYFIYNGFVFTGIVPVSGATKVAASNSMFDQGNGYDFVENMRTVITLVGQHIRLEIAGLLLVLEVCFYVLLVYGLGRRFPKHKDHLLLVFLICVLSLGLEHLSKIIFAILNLHPQFVTYSSWYYVPAFLMNALIVPIRCYMVIYIIKCLSIFQPFGMMVSKNCIIIFGLIWILVTNNFVGHWIYIDQKRDSLKIDGQWDYNMSSYIGALILNRILPQDSVIGSWDSGIVGYTSKFPVINLDGLANSYDYYRGSYRTSIHSHYKNNRSDIYDNINWFANIRRVAEKYENDLIFEGITFGSRESHGGKRTFWVWPRESLSESPDETTDSVFKIWQRLQPYANLQLDDIIVIVDGRLVHTFVNNCVPIRLQNDLLVYRDQKTHTIKTLHLGKMYRNHAGVCVDAFILPIGKNPPVGITRETLDP